jgi:hypothetical protein
VKGSWRTDASIACCEVDAGDKCELQSILDEGTELVLNSSFNFVEFYCSNFTALLFNVEFGSLSELSE